MNIKDYQNKIKEKKEKIEELKEIVRIFEDYATDLEDMLNTANISFDDRDSRYRSNDFDYKL